MEFRQLTTFKTVAQTLSFTRTAGKLHMAQSSVSAQIKALEEDLGVRLFDRIGRRVLLTDAGQKLYGYARRMENMTREIRTDLAGSGPGRGTLTLRVPESLAVLYMSDILAAFHSDYPDVRLVCMNCTDRQLREELNSGRIDLAFLMIDDILFKEVNVRLLREEALTLVASPDHPLAGMDDIRFPDLEEVTLLMPKTD